MLLRHQLLATPSAAIRGAARSTSASTALAAHRLRTRYVATESTRWLTDEEAANAKLLEAVQSRVDQFQAAQDVSEHVLSILALIDRYDSRPVKRFKSKRDAQRS